MTETAKLKAEIDAAWKWLDQAWDIEPRAYFEKEAPKNGFVWPLCQALHHVWKRNAKVEALEAALTSERSQREAAEQELARWEGDDGLLSAIRRLRGFGPDWPDHSNAPLAIAASYALLVQERDALTAALADATRERDTDREALQALRGIVDNGRHEDHDGPCWCGLRNAGFYEALGHSDTCKRLKAIDAALGRP